MKYFLDRNPFSILEDMFDTKTSVMRVDVKEDEKDYIIDAELPGFNKDDLKIDYKDGYLSIEATQNKEVEINNHKYITKERYQGNYVRKFYVGEVDIESIKAKFENGLLTVTLPKEMKKEEVKKQINIE